MMREFAIAILFFRTLAAQSGPWQATAFLEGTWEAKTTKGSSGIDATGAYTFRKELSGHILVRQSDAGGCKAPGSADCDHKDLLYVYQERPDAPLQAIYFDNEGHVIHYAVSVPAANRVVFLSDGAVVGPQYRLSYERRGAAMDGRFEIRMPGSEEWTSYLEWTGAKR